MRLSLQRLAASRIPSAVVLLTGLRQGSIDNTAGDAMNNGAY